MIAGAVKLCDGGDDGGLAEDAHLLVGECELGDVKRSGLKGSEGVVAGLERAVCIDADVVGVEQGTEGCDVLTEKRGAPLLLQREDGVAKMMALDARHGLHGEEHRHGQYGDGQARKQHETKTACNDCAER